MPSVRLPGSGEIRCGYGGGFQRGRHRWKEGAGIAACGSGGRYICNSSGSRRLITEMMLIMIKEM
jgi:hypothetical protein